MCLFCETHCKNSTFEKYYYQFYNFFVKVLCYNFYLNNIHNLYRLWILDIIFSMYNVDNKKKQKNC